MPSSAEPPPPPRRGRASPDGGGRSGRGGGPPGGQASDARAPDGGAPPPGRSRVIGLLGGIASGKSAVARLIAGRDGLVIDADRVAREVLEEPDVQSALVAALGPAVRGPQGLDRAAIARLAFASPAARAALESLTHPLIRARIRASLDAAIAGAVPRIVLDVPLLLENAAAHGLLAECGELVFVDADPAVRDARAIASRGWSPGEVARREAAQLPLAEKRARADHVIRNQGSLEELEGAVRDWLARGRSRGP